MQLSSKTLDILKNFSSINPALVLRTGTTQRTVSTGKNILASATIAEEIPRDCPIYDLPKLLGVLSLFDDPDVVFDADHLRIQSGSSSVKFAYADPSVIKSEDRQFNMPSPFLTLALDETSLAQLSRAAAVLKAVDIEIAYDGKKKHPTVAALVDVKNQSSDRYTTQPSAFAVTNDALESCRIIFKNEHLKLLPGEYQISLATKGRVIVAEFENKTTPVTYYLSAEPTHSSVAIGEAAGV